MIVLTRGSLPWVPHTGAWMSGTNPLQTPRAWFWGTHKWAISAALLGGRVSRVAGNVLVFGPFVHRATELRSTPILFRQLFFFFFCVPQLDLWGSPFLVRFFFSYVTVFYPTIEVVTFRLHGQMAIQSAVACSEAKDDGLLMLLQLMECVVSSSLSVEDGFLFIMDKSFILLAETINQWRRGRNQSTRRKPLITSFRKCQILKPENSSPNRDLNPHFSIGDRLGKHTC